MRMKCKRMRRASIGVRANMAIVRAEEVIEGGMERPSTW